MTEKEELEKQIEKIDKLTPSPSARAKKVLEILSHHKFSNWDLICFSVEYFASQALVYTWLKVYIKPVVRVIYNAHYYMPESSYLTEVYDNDSSGTNKKT